MNDYEYTFRADVREKKSTAMSARNKVCGANSTKVSLPQDTLSNKELAERNGPMKAYNLSKPMTWKQFRLMPRDLQQEYLEKLREKYNATGCAIGRMMGIEKTTFNLYVKDTILEDPLKHRRMSEAQVLLWDNFLNPPKKDAVESVDDESDSAIEEPVVEEPVEEATEVFRAHDYQVEEPASCPTPEPSYAAIPQLSFRLAGTPGEMLLSLQGLLNALPWNETYEADISMALQDGDLL